MALMLLYPCGLDVVLPKHIALWNFWARSWLAFVLNVSARVPPRRYWPNLALCPSVVLSIYLAPAVSQLTLKYTTDSKGTTDARDNS